MNASNVETLVPMTCNHILQLFGCKPLGLGFSFQFCDTKNLAELVKFRFKTTKNQKNTIVQKKKKKH